ncbi:DNA repair protein RecO C-terminal domain-containing protein [Metamycoplasma canadense]|uniref:DNA repair protein RecO n=1 Tax=Metamycoplasma canadense TaxID=29554 RepID=A0A077L6S3_9BACT|nr:DNA repair protein RecO C-terminal domain-containing protein [Metamycoplasma canadense]BAP39486.1 hypothetical protein MCAN360_0265 [Metamycoplasma canadense]
MENKEFESLAIILDIKEYNNFSLVKVLMPNGINFLYAKGLYKVESKNKRNLPILGLSNLEIIKSKKINNNNTLKKASLISYFPNSEMLQEIYDTVLFFLSRLNNVKLEDFFENYQLFLKNVLDKPKHSFCFFLLNILKVLGLQPIFLHCCECSNKDNIIDFEFYKGGFLCSEHSNNNKDVILLKTLYWLNKNFEYFLNNTDENWVILIIKMMLDYLKN